MGKDDEILNNMKEPYKRHVKKIIEECKRTNINHRWDDLFQRKKPSLVLSFPYGDGKKDVVIFDDKDAKQLLAQDFSDVVFVPEYTSAICSKKKNFIETYISCFNKLEDKFSILSSLTDISYRDVESFSKIGKPTEFTLTNECNTSMSISISEPSDIFKIFSSYSEGDVILTAKIQGVTFSSVDEVKLIIRKLLDSLFKQILNSHVIALYVPQEHPIKYLFPDEYITKRDRTIQFPKYEYDNNTFRLYWRAKSVIEMPLMQYLIYYQILEFYFSKYSKSYFKEEKQLRDTIKGILSLDEFNSVIFTKKVKEYFHQDYRLVSRKILDANNKKYDLLNQFSDRIYDIRCKIVHTKKADKILPFTIEEELLENYDLKMLERVIDKVLNIYRKPISFVNW